METSTVAPSHHDAQLCDLCDRLIQLGYAQSKRVRIYGEEFEMVSNPFPQGKGVAVQAVSKREPKPRVLQLPLPILQMAVRKKTA
jgi:hypothetical protein